MSESKAVLLYHLRAGHPRKVIWFKWWDGVGWVRVGTGASQSMPIFICFIIILSRKLFSVYLSFYHKGQIWPRRLPLWRHAFEVNFHDCILYIIFFNIMCIVTVHPLKIINAPVLRRKGIHIYKTCLSKVDFFLFFSVK